MSQVKVGKWGKHLAIQFPFDIASAVNLNNGEWMEIEIRSNNDIVIHRRTAQARADAQAAAEEIIAASKKHSLGDITAQELVREARGG